jgi:hypothetical protein
LNYVGHSGSTNNFSALLLLDATIRFQSSFLSPIVYANFLRFRYFFSIHTRAAFALIRARTDAMVAGNPKLPPQAVKAYEVMRGAVTRFGMAAVQQPGANRAQ